MITVTFLNGCILATAEQSLWQYSYNQQLQINGLELPGVFTVDFCNEGDTTTVAMIGSSGVVGIPNELLTSGRDIVAYVFQKSVLTGGITRCEIRIDVLTRPERDDETPTPEQEAVIDQYIAELNEGVENAETAAANAQTSEDNAAASAADAQQSKADAAASASAAADSASDASNSAAAAAQSAVNASNSAANAANASGEASGYAEDSEAWAIGKRNGSPVNSTDETYHNNSKYFAEQAFTSSSNANSSASAAAQSERDAAASANGAAQSASSATASKNAAANSASAAAGSATAAQSSATSAAASATAASGSATSAGNSSAAAAQSATEAGNAQTAAEAAQTAAEEAAASVSASAAQIAQNTSDISAINDKIPSTASKNNKLVAWSTFNGQLGTKQAKITANGILKGDGAGGVSAAVAGTDYLAPSALDAYRTAAAQDEIDAAQDEDIADVEAAVDQKAPIIINSASGDIAHFEDGADNMPIKALSVNVEPIQDLHGQASPYPAGGGPNKFPPLTSATINGVTITVADDGTVTINGTASTDAYFDCNFTANITSGVTFYFCAFNPVASTSNRLTVFLITGNGNPQINLNTANAIYSSQSSADTTASKWRLRVPSGVTYSNFVVKPMLQVGGTAPTAYAPYSNICPISGRTSATVTRTGKNLLKLSDWETESDSGITIGTDNISIINKGYQETLNRYNVLNRSACVFSFHVKTIALNDSRASFAVYADGTVKLTGSGTAGTGNIELNSVGTEKDITVTVPNGTEYISFGGWAWGGEVQISNLQLELGSTATAYEPYQGNTYTIALGDTVYGGTLDVTGGKMVVDRAMVDLGTLTWALNAQGFMWSPGIRSTAKPPATSSILGNIICSDFQAVTAISIYNGVNGISLHMNGDIRVRYDNMPTDTSAFKAAMSGVQLCYELATPIEITLTPTQIETLLGTNNIWSDAGAVNVDYCADTKLYIQNIHQPTENDMTADAQIASGKYFLVGGNLYKSTTVIPAGDTIIPGTNCIKTDLAEALNALNA